MMLKMRSH